MSALSELINDVFDFHGLEEEERRRRKMAVELALGISFCGLLYCLVYVMLGFPKATITSASAILLTFLNLCYFYFSKNYNAFKYLQLGIILGLGLLCQYILGGYVDSSAVGFCAILPAIGALFFANVRTARILLVFFILGLIGQAIWEFLHRDHPYHMPREVSLLFFVLNFIFIGTILYFILENFFDRLNLFEQRAKEEKDKADQLLLNILPEETAAELKQDGRARARSYASATILFADFVNFSTTTQSLTPQQIVQELDIYFQEFDNIVDRHGLEKIKTIGDTYMCVGGLPTENNTHAQDAVRAALEIIRFVESRKTAANVAIPFDVRIGIHTGAVVAGIVGKKKFVYDIWGEAVNIAARMEQNAPSGRINLSAATYFLVNRQIPCIFSGKINAKNIGELDAYGVDMAALNLN